MTNVRPITIVLITLLGGILCHGADQTKPKEESVSDDRQQLVGVWEFVSIRSGQREQRANANRPSVLEITKDKIVRKSKSSENVFRYEVDPSKNPKQLDWVTERNGNKDVSRRIYEVKGDELRMCFSPGGERPADFTAKADVIMLTFRRQTAESRQAAARARQIGLQMSPGAIAFLQAEVVRELDLIAAQQTVIREIIDATTPKFNEVAAKIRKETDTESRRKLIEEANQIRADAKQQVVDEVLNDEQKKKWKEMLGGPATEEEKRSYQPRGRSRSRQSRSSVEPPRIPALKQIHRVTVGDTPTATERSMALWIQETRAHPVAGDGYIVLTDHADGDYLDALAKLARHRKGQVITIADFRQLCESENAVHAIRDKLRQVSPRFIALAPRLENLSENTMLCIWDLLSQLDEDPQIDVFPGILVAATKEAFVRLINNSIGAKPNENPLKAFGICQATGREGLRSFQKIELLKREMASRGGSMASAVIGPASALEVTRSVSSPGGERWEVASSGRFVPGLPEPVEEAVEDSSLVLLFGHGAPGMVCGVEIAAFDDIDLTGKVVLSGCCFAGMGNRTDIAQPKQGPDGSVIQTDRRKFVLTAVDRGAILAYGHMRLSNGFPTVAPLLEGLLAGKSTGEVYQQLLNSVIEYHHVESGFAGESSCDVAKIARRINPLLHVLVGDPAVVAFQPGQLTE